MVENLSLFKKKKKNVLVNMNKFQQKKIRYIYNNDRNTFLKTEGIPTLD